MEKREIIEISTRVIAICDDEEFYRVQCRNMCEVIFKNYGQKVEILEFASANELIGSKKQLDLVFLDIDMPGLTGIEAKRMLAKAQPRAAIIFITNYPEYKDVAFGRNVEYFIEKPLAIKEIYHAVTQINKDLSFDDDNIIVNYKRVILSQVRYIKGEDKYVRFVLYGGNYEIVRGTMNEWEEKLKDKPFFRIHKSYIVNLQWMKNIDGTKLNLKNGGSIPISRQLKKRLLEEYCDFLESMSY